MKRTKIRFLPCQADKHRTGTPVVIPRLVKKSSDVLTDGFEVSFLAHYL
jgi:hypothetical protein